MAPRIPSAKSLENAPERYEVELQRCQLTEARQACVPRRRRVVDQFRAKFRPAVLAAVHLSNERADSGSTVRMLCSWLEVPDKRDERQLNTLLMYIQDKVCSGGVKAEWYRCMRVERLRKHRWSPGPEKQNSFIRGSQLQCRLQDPCTFLGASSSCSFIMRGRAVCSVRRTDGSDSDQGEDGGLVGSMNIELLSDSSAVRQFCHNRGIGAQKRLETRALWFQHAVLEGLAQVRRVVGEKSFADMIAGSPRTKELAKFSG